MYHNFHVEGVYISGHYASNFNTGLYTTSVQTEEIKVVIFNESWCSQTQVRDRHRLTSLYMEQKREKKRSELVTSLPGAEINKKH
jgi:hypothetical protein